MKVRRGHHRFGAAALLLLATIACRDAFAGQLTLTWVDNSSDEAGSSVERGSSATGPFAEIGTLGPGATSLTDSDLGDATTYCYRVRAFSAAAYSDYSNVACGRTPQVFGLAVVKMGGGNGSVLSTPSGIACGASCSGSYPSGTAVSLSAAPGTGSIFSGWGGACSGIGPCAVSLSASTVVTAAFDPPSFPLTVSKVGSGGGKIISTPAGIKCGATCSASYPGSTAVTLTAKPSVGSVFTGWGGSGCTGIGACIVSLSAATSVTANFAQ